MENMIKSTALIATRMILRQLASVLLKCGVTWKDFSNLSKSVFVEVASKEFGIKGRDTNISRVSILTGISRKEIKRLKENSQESNENLVSKPTDATRLLAAWYLDPDFVDADGVPKILSLEGESHSFNLLHERYGGDIPVQAMLKELVNTKSVEINKDSKNTSVKVLRRYFIPKSLDSEMLLHFGRALHDHAATINKNINQEKKSDPLFERVASVNYIDKKHLKEFNSYLNVKGQAFLEDIDAWLIARSSPTEQPSTKTIRLGAGIYALHSLSIEENDL